MELPVELHSKIVEFLTSLPNVHDSSAQRAFINSASLDSQLKGLISYSGSPAQFFQLLVSTLMDYGKLEDGRDALEAVLEATKNSIGKDRREYCGTLIQELRAFRKLHIKTNISEPNRAEIKEERFLDAAIPDQVIVDEETELLILIRLPDSEGLRKFLKEQQFFEAKPEEVRSKKFDIYFPTNEQGSITFLDLLISIEANGFSINKREEKIRVYPSKDSALCTFFVTPRKAGKLIITINVYSTEIIAKDSGKTLISSGYIGLYSHTKLGEKINALKKLVTFSLGAFGISSKKDTSQIITATNHSSVSDVAQSHIDGDVSNSEVTVTSGDVVKGNKISIKDIQADRTTIIGQLNIGKFDWNKEGKERLGNTGKSSETHRHTVQATKEDMLRFLLRVYRVEPRKKVNSQEIRKHLGLTREQMHDMILDLKEKGFIKATFLGDKALLEITTDGVTVLKE